MLIGSKAAATLEASSATTREGESLRECLRSRPPGLSALRPAAPGDRENITFPLPATQIRGRWSPSPGCEQPSGHTTEVVAAGQSHHLGEVLGQGVQKAQDTLLPVDGQRVERGSSEEDSPRPECERGQPVSRVAYSPVDVHLRLVADLADHRREAVGRGGGAVE